MRPDAPAWDYLIVSASNAHQARAYRSQLELRRKLGLIPGVRNVLVVADPPGRRIGSGGSTILCLIEALHRELPQAPLAARPEHWRQVLRGRRILIIHGGGDSRRLPAYSPCGKIFVPVPAENDSAVPLTLFDLQLPTYLALPPMPDGRGQLVIAAGDVLLRFDPSDVRFRPAGLTGLGCLAAPERAAGHGVFCATPEGRVRLFLQKPSPEEQARWGAIDRYGQAMLDIGILNLDADAALSLLVMCGTAPGADGRLGWTGPIGQAIETLGLDLYTEVCCGMGVEATAERHRAWAWAGGSKWDARYLEAIHHAVSPLPFHAQCVPRCEFMHFGTTRQIIDSGIDLVRSVRGTAESSTCLSIQNHIEPGGTLAGTRAWVEACRLRAPLTLRHENVAIGLDVDQPLELPSGACIDVLPGHDRNGRRVWFVRCYGVDDSFKESPGREANLHGMPLSAWLAAMGACEEDLWSPQTPPERRSIWEARLFPAETDPQGYRRWLWLFDIASATADQKQAWMAADRYSHAEIAELADQDAFSLRRLAIRAESIRRAMRRMFHTDSGFSAAELAFVLGHVEDRQAVLAELVAEARWHYGADRASGGREAFVSSRILHSLGSALERLDGSADRRIAEALPGLAHALTPADREWLATIGLGLDEDLTLAEWAGRARSTAFSYLGQVIVSASGRRPDHPVSALRSDEIVWGRAPARLDLGGGWTDTPPYSLECGGCVINAAVDLNGQPPIHAYARVIREPVIRIASIDLGTRIEVRELDDLLDYRKATSEFGLAKAALVLSGFSPETAVWPEPVSLPRMLEHFGGGIELTTLAAVPKGSGLGTSSIMGAVLLAVIQRVMGRSLTWQEIFNGVLRLEQALTTGGGWQDQVGGAVGEVKVVTAEPGLTPEARIHFVPSDVLDPRANGGCTLLYYTGLTRLAKNILQQVVGRYLDRDRAAMATLRQLHRLPARVADAMARKDLPAFGALIDVAWRLNKQLDPDSSNEAIEGLLARVAPHVFGAKLLGAGGGGFLLMVCKTPSDAAAVRRLLEADPPNARARFFDFDISRQGLVVTVC